MNQNYIPQKTPFFSDSRGFTLVEMMIALVISTIIIAAIYTSYEAQQRIHTAQSQVAEIQQNIRAAMDILTREVRMTGFHAVKFGAIKESFDSSCNLGAVGAATAPGILLATPTSIDISMDLNADGDCADSGENLTYRLYINADGQQQFGRRDNTGGAAIQPVAENFDGIEFIYLDGAGTPTAVLADIRSIQVSLLARAGRPDRNIYNTLTYTPASGVANNWGPFNDFLRRRLMTTTVALRNMGL